MKNRFKEVKTKNICCKTPHNFLWLQREQLSGIDESGIRRSSRARRSTYLTYNQKILEQGYETDEQPRKRRCGEVVEVENNDVRHQFIISHCFMKRTTCTIQL